MSGVRGVLDRLGMDRQALLERMARQITPSEIEVAQGIAEIMAERERTLLEAVATVADAGDVDVGVPRVDAAARQEMILELADAMTDQHLAEWWAEEVLAEHVDDVEGLVEYLEMDGAEWGDQVREWAAYYRESHPELVHDMTDAEIAALHVRNKWGVSLREFVAEIVAWTPGTAFEDVLDANLGQAERSLSAVARDLEEG
jgi:hypothetical protein